MKDVVIVSAVRTPVGKFQGAFAEMTAVQLGAIAVREAVKRAGIDPASVDECLMGCVLPAGLGQSPARQAALQGGLADTVSAMTINMVCGSGLKAVGVRIMESCAGMVLEAGVRETPSSGRPAARNRSRPARDSGWSGAGTRLADGRTRR